MKISGFTIVRNAIQYRYPVIESINSILPICDEFIVNVGDSKDGTLELIQSIQSPKIKIVQTIWDMNKGSTVLSEQTNIALGHCTGDWAFYLQTDEVIHESDLPRLVACMKKSFNNPDVDALRFRWLHFYGSHYRYRIDAGWYQKQDRIVRNNGEIRSYGDAFAFERKDGKSLRTTPTGAFIYHYGWVQMPEDMLLRKQNAQAIGYAFASEQKQAPKPHDYGDLNRFPIYFGSHPKVMNHLVEHHPLSQADLKEINRKHWWNPLKVFNVRYKTGRRIKTKIT